MRCGDSDESMDGRLIGRSTMARIRLLATEADHQLEASQTWDRVLRLEEDEEPSLGTRPLTGASLRTIRVGMWVWSLCRARVDIPQA